MIEMVGVGGCTVLSSFCQTLHHQSVVRRRIRSRPSHSQWIHGGTASIITYNPQIFLPLHLSFRNQFFFTQQLKNKKKKPKFQPGSALTCNSNNGSALICNSNSSNGSALICNSNSSNGSALICNSNNGSALICNSSNGSALICNSSNGSALNCNSNNGSALIWNSNNGSAPIWNSSNGSALICNSSNGSALICNSNNGSALICNSSNGSALICNSSNGSALNCNSNNGSALIWNSNNGSAPIWNSSNGSALICNSSNGSALNCNSNNGSALIWNSNNGSAPIWNSSNGSALICNSSNGSALICNSNNGSALICKSSNGLKSISSDVYEDDDDEFIVVNFYRFVWIEDPEAEITKHLSFLEDFDIHGRIYINEQGINAQFSGPVKDSLRYVEWLKQDPKFSEILVQISPAINNGHAFPKLKLGYKPSLVQFEGGISNLPLLEPSMRAIPLTPNEWRVKLLNNSDRNPNFVLLDVRNGYEWDIGHFDGARRPEVDCFRTTSFGLSETETETETETGLAENSDVDDDPLSGVDKERTDVLMYCTGGIRCDVYSAILRQRGYKNLYTLKGGVSHYLQNEGPVGWIGNLFVFDSRLSLPPGVYKPEVSVSVSVTEVKDEPDEADNNSPFARCYICGLKRLNELRRHRNCANLDCNLLFLCCNDCVEKLRGCCCSDCTSAPRLRPVLPGHQRYKKWHIYRDSASYKQIQLHDTKSKQVHNG